MDYYLILQAPNPAAELTREIAILNTPSYPHIVSSKDSFHDEREKIYYIVTDYCQGGNIAAQMKSLQTLQESKVLSWFVEICMALKFIHEKGLLHKHLTPKSVLLTEFGIVCLDKSGKIYENLKSNASTTDPELSDTQYLPPELFTDGNYDAKSDIWSVGCILYELCTQEPAFAAETQVKLMPKIIRGPYPSLPDQFSPELCGLLHDIFKREPQSRPSAREILDHPFILSCLLNKARTTVEELQEKLTMLRTVADHLECVHQGTTIGSLAGGVIGAVGGITSVVGLILAPFTLGASLIVTGVGVGVGVLGGATAGASNIKKVVNQSSDRQAIRSIIKGFEQKIKAVVTWLQEISDGLQSIRGKCASVNTFDTENGQLNAENLTRIGLRAGRSTGGIAELVRLIQVINIGKIAAQASRAVRVAEVATGVLSGLFIAVDIFFIAMDAKEIHHIRQAKAAKESTAQNTVTSETEFDDISYMDSNYTFDRRQLLHSSVMQESESETSMVDDQSSPNTTQVRSEVMRFILSVRQAADNLQEVLDQLSVIISVIPSFGVPRELNES